MAPNRRWGPAPTALAVLVVALAVVAVVGREWWLLAVAGGCAAILAAQLGDDRRGDRGETGD